MTQCTSLELHLQPLQGSSIWTGDAQQQMSYLKATSFLGGLRFWTQALLRTQGQHVHDDMGSCLHDAVKSHKTCAACQIFGCTGLGRSFSLKVDNTNFRSAPYGNKKEDTKCIPLPSYKDAFGKESRPPTYYIKKAHGELVKLRFSMQRPVQDMGGDVQWNLSPTLLRAALLMFEYGTLGAYDQYGCGFVNFKEQEQVTQLRKIALASSVSCQKKSSPMQGTSLEDFFFFQGKVKAYDEKLPFLLRRNIRDALRSMKDDKLRHWFCGSLKADQPQPKGNANSGSKYNLCLTNSGILYGWGYFPRHLIQKLTDYTRERDTVLTHVKNILEASCETFLWKEFGETKRDTCDSPHVLEAYIEDMLAKPWKERL